MWSFFAHYSDFVSSFVVMKLWKFAIQHQLTEWLDSFIYYNLYKVLLHVPKILYDRNGHTTDTLYIRFKLVINYHNIIIIIIIITVLIYTVVSMLLVIGRISKYDDKNIALLHYIILTNSLLLYCLIFLFYIAYTYFNAAVRNNTTDELVR